VRVGIRYLPLRDGSQKGSAVRSSSKTTIPPANTNFPVKLQLLWLPQSILTPKWQPFHERYSSGQSVAKPEKDCSDRNIRAIPLIR
jgi:hypothetical protein